MTKYSGIYGKRFYLIVLYIQEYILNYLVYGKGQWQIQNSRGEAGVEQNMEVAAWKCP